MRKIILLIFVLLVCVLSRRNRKSSKGKNQRKGCPLANYDHNVLSLSWPIKFCSSSECLNNWQQLWQGNVATIHGFWPTWSQNIPKPCQKKYMGKGDPACSQGAYLGNIRFLKIDEVFKDDPQLIKDIRSRWPSLKHQKDRQTQQYIDPDWFYAHQWTKHGTCYLRNLIQEHQDGEIGNLYRYNSTILKKYFSDTIDKVKSLNIILQPGKTYYSKSQFAKDIGFQGKQDNFYVNCQGKQISEILICYSRSERPGQEVLISCPKQRRVCYPPFSVRNYDD